MSWRIAIQCSLGIPWDLNEGVFTFAAPTQEKLFTRRSVLSVVNSLYDPLGFVAPVTVQRKSLLRELVVESCDSDCPLLDDKRARWEMGKSSLQVCEQRGIPDTYASTLLPYSARSCISRMHQPRLLLRWLTSEWHNQMACATWGSSSERLS